MKKKSPSPASSNLPVSKQTAGGVSGAIIGGVIGGPVGAVAGAIAGTIMGNRASKGKPLLSSGTVKTARTAAQAVKAKLPMLKGKSKPTKAKAAAPRKTAAPKKSLKSGGGVKATTPKAAASRKRR